MRRFTWRLQRVLDVKAKEEQLRQTELFRLTEELTAKRGELFMRQRVLQNLLADLGRDRSPDRLYAQEFFLRRASVDDERIRKIKEEIEALIVKQKEKTAEMLAVRRFKEGLEKLRTQAKKEYIREEEQLEQKESDDRAAIAFTREKDGELAHDTHGRDEPLLHYRPWKEQNR